MVASRTARPPSPESGADSALKLGEEVVDAAVGGSQARVVGLRNLHPERRMKPDHDVEQIHRVEIQLIPKGHVGLERSEVGLRGDLAQDVEHGGAHLVPCHSRPGSWSSRSTAARKRPPRWPSLTRWSAEARGYAMILHSITRPRSDPSSTYRVAEAADSKPQPGQSPRAQHVCRHDEKTLHPDDPPGLLVARLDRHHAETDARHGDQHRQEMVAGDDAEDGCSEIDDVHDH